MKAGAHEVRGEVCLDGLFFWSRFGRFWTWLNKNLITIGARDVSPGKNVGEMRVDEKLDRVIGRLECGERWRTRTEVCEVAGEVVSIVAGEVVSIVAGEVVDVVAGEVVDSGKDVVIDEVACEVVSIVADAIVKDK